MARASGGAPPSPSSTIFLCGGGTGGHVYPALAVAEAIAAAENGPWPLVYVGSVGGMEEQIVASESSLPFRAIPAAAVRGRSPLALARGAATTLAGVRAARRLI